MQCAIGKFKAAHNMATGIKIYVENDFKTDSFKRNNMKMGAGGNVGKSFFNNFFDVKTIVKMPIELKEAISRSTLIVQSYSRAKDIRNEDLKETKTLKKVPHYYQLDVNSAFMARFCFEEKMPKDYIGCYEGYVKEEADEYCMYVDHTGRVMFRELANEENTSETFVFNLLDKEIRKRVAKEYKKIYISEDKKIFKAVINAGIGMFHHDNIALASAIWMANTQFLIKERKKLIDKKIKVIKVHTDSIGFILEPWQIMPHNIKVSSNLGNFKWEYFDRTIALKNAGTYKIYDKDGNLIVYKNNKDLELMKNEKEEEKISEIAWETVFQNFEDEDED